MYYPLAYPSSRRMPPAAIDLTDTHKHRHTHTHTDVSETFTNNSRSLKPYGKLYGYVTPCFTLIRSNILCKIGVISLL